jgi:hypothetical protein
MSQRRVHVARRLFSLVQTGGMLMQTLRLLALSASLLCGGLGLANVAAAAPATGLIEAAPAVTASATAPSRLLIQKAYYHHYWHHHYYWHHHHYWHHRHYWHRHYWHRCWHCW